MTVTRAAGWHPEPELISVRDAERSREAARDAGSEIREGRVARVERLIRIAGIAAVVLLAALPATSLAASRDRLHVDRVVIADVPPRGGEDCVEDPDAQPGVGLRECPKGFDVATLLPFVAGGVGIVLAVAVGWLLVMRRRLSRPFLADATAGVGAPGSGAGAGSGSGTGSGVGSGSGTASGAGSGSDVGEWWTCRSCGATNLVESARCYSCGTWRR